MKNFTIVIAVLLLIFSAGELSAEPSGRAKTTLTEPVDPPRLFVIPTTKVLNSLDMTVAGGGVLGIEKDRTFLARVEFGLGDVAEVEFRTNDILSTLSKGITSMPTAAFKMKIMNERAALPALAWAYKKSLWKEDFNSSMMFRSRMSILYLVGGKTVGIMKLYAGLSFQDCRLETWKAPSIYGNYSSQITAVDTIIITPEIYKIMTSPFGGLEIKVNPKTKIMAEVSSFASFEYNKVTGIQTADDITQIMVYMIGIRYFFNNWLSVDVGTRYQTNYTGFADSTVTAAMNIAVPLHRTHEPDTVDISE